jgi:hypothetical protein
MSMRMLAATIALIALALFANTLQTERGIIARVDTVCGICHGERVLPCGTCAGSVDREEACCACGGAGELTCGACREKR